MASSTRRNRIARNKPSIRTLCGRLQSIKRSSTQHVGSPGQSVGSSIEGASQVMKGPEDVVLNYQNMDQELGLRPARARCTPGPRTPRNTPMGSLVDTQCRLTVDDRGQFRYFGYSSSMGVVSILPQSPSDSLRQSGEDTVEEVEGSSIADAPETQMHLIDMFFKYQHASLPILDEDVFRAGYARGTRSEYYSKFLLYTLLLRAVKFGDFSHPETLSQIYLQRARAELLFEIENPAISTIPALCLLGHYLGSLGSDRACWLYPGMAYRLVFDFGLHEDCTELITAGLLTETDQRVRQVIVYGCYVLDKLYSAFQGRPTAVRLNDIATPRLEGRHQLVTAWVELASLLDKVISVINGPPGKIYHDASVRKLSEASRALVEWFDNLPPELQWNHNQVRSPSPAICALHTQFLSTTILLNRPFAAYMFKSGRRSSSRGKCLDGQTAELSQQICTANAVRISKLLLTYRRHFGASKFFATINPPCLSAAMALISDIVTAQPGENKAKERKALTAIIDTLEEITPSYPVAGRSRNTLAAIMNTCGLSDLLNQPQLSLQQPWAEAAAEHLPVVTPEASWNLDRFLFDEADDVHNIGLMDFFTQPLQHSDYWAPEAVFFDEVSGQSI